MPDGLCDSNNKQAELQRKYSLNEHNVVIYEFLPESSKAAMIAKDSGDYAHILVNLAKRRIFIGGNGGLVCDLSGRART
jgi:hypothetical protein